jgi:hypothetical protein
VGRGGEELVAHLQCCLGRGPSSLLPIEQVGALGLRLLALGDVTRNRRRAGDPANRILDR